MQTIKKMLKYCNIPFSGTAIKIFHDIRFKAKLHQFPFHNSTTGARYYVAFPDAYLKHTWIYLLHTKSQTASHKLFY